MEKEQMLQFFREEFEEILSTLEQDTQKELELCNQGTGEWAR